MYLSINQISKRLGVSYGTVRNEILAGRLVAVQIASCYRVDESDLEAYLAQAKVSKPSATPKRRKPVKVVGVPASAWMDRAAMLAAWRELGVLTAPIDGDNAPSSESKRGPSTPQGS